MIGPHPDGGLEGNAQGRDMLTRQEMEEWHDPRINNGEAVPELPVSNSSSSPVGWFVPQFFRLFYHTPARVGRNSADYLP